MAASESSCCSYFLVGKLTFLLLIIAPVTVSAVCRFGKIENGCVFNCNCQSNSKCNSNIGCEVGSCQKDILSGGPFSGQGCQIGNLAFKKSASQIGTYDGMIANRSVDGYIDGENNHCSHPLSKNNNAWWMVDLGDNSVIHSVNIFSGKKADGNKYLHHLSIGIGNSANVDDHNQCTTHTAEIPPNTNVTLTCEGTGQYVSIKKTGGNRTDVMFLCEVVVKGYKYIDCTGSCDGSCNHVTGCDKCQAGKKLPVCKQDCNAGSYGVNCAESCGHCAAGSAPCDPVTGSCTGRCQQWYGLDTCKTDIIRVDYQSTPKKLSVTSSSVSVSWPQSAQVPPGLESYYQYVVEYADGQGTETLTRPFIAGQDDQSVEIKGLKDNTDYYIKVRIDARHNNKTKQGYAGQTLTLKTKNTAPAKPKTDSVTATDPVSIGSGGQSPWHLAEAPVTATKAAVATTKATVATTKAAVATTKVTVVTTEGPTSETQTDDSGSDYTGVIIGVVMALVVLIVIVVAVVFVRLRKKDGMCKRTASPRRHPPLAGPQVAQAERELDQEEEEVERVNPVPEEGIYMNLVHASTMVQVDKLEAYIKERDTIRDGFVPEYNKLPRTDMNKVKTAKLPDNVPLNRFKNIWPYDHSRVKLQMDDDHPSDYINASYITGYKDKANTYIACQGPRQNTLSDMWQMIWQLKITRIVMVTQLSESGRRKCDIYWPLTVGTQKVYGRVTVVTLSCDVYADYTIRTFQLTCEEGSRKVTHFQYTSWVDRGVPKYTYPLLALHRLIRSYDKHSSGPMVVHCSAGVGRTGTFIALDSLLDQAEAERQVDVYRFVSHMRTERMEMVQTQVQYVFLYHALLDSLKTGHLAYPLAQYPDVYKRLCDDENNLTELREQFQMLEALRPDPPGPSSAGLLKSNKNKNRSIDIIPDDNNRPYLTSRCPGTNDYINAVYVDSYRRRISFLLTQIPRPNTKIDFWRLILDHECPTIIMLDEGDGEAYWPNEEDPKEAHGTLTVELLNERYTTIQNVVERELKVYLTATPNHVHKVKQYQLTSGWPCNDDVPNNSTTFLNLVELANRPVSEDDGSGPTILQCMNGASHSGLFCAATRLLGSLSIDQYVDIFHSAQHVRNMRPQAISSLEQYKFLHKLVIDYQGQHATYMNVPPSNRIA